MHTRVTYGETTGNRGVFGSPRTKPRMLASVAASRQGWTPAWSTMGHAGFRQRV